MAEFKNYREESRRGWGNTQDQALSMEQITLGAVLRIADAVEKMAQRYTELIGQRDYWERQAVTAQKALDTERRRAASLRGHLKRKKSA